MDCRFPGCPHQARYPKLGLCNGHYYQQRQGRRLKPLRQSRRGTDRVSWKKLLPIAADIVESYASGVTLRQLFYRLVAAGHIPNMQTVYGTLSRYTAEARREEEFPDLVDNTRRIDRPLHFDSPADGMRSLAEWYRLDRTQGQEHQVWLVVEKAALRNLIVSEFKDQGVPVVALGGYGSQTLKDQINRQIEEDGRPSVLIYAGDFDPSGDWETPGSIPSDFVARTDFDEHVHLGLTPEQAEGLPFNPYPEDKRDARAREFIRIHGSLQQYELDALPPDRLLGLYRDALMQKWDVSKYSAVVAEEKEGRERLEELAEEEE
jgi:hypothetical protein